MLFLKSISKQWKAVTVQFNIFELYDSEKKGSCKDCFSLSGADPGFSEGGGGGSDKLLVTLSNCYCCLTSPFSQEKVRSRYLCLFHFGGFDRTTPRSATGLCSWRENQSDLPGISGSKMLVSVFSLGKYGTVK